MWMDKQRRNTPQTNIPGNITMIILPGKKGDIPFNKEPRYVRFRCPACGASTIVPLKGDIPWEYTARTTCNCMAPLQLEVTGNEVTSVLIAIENDNNSSKSEMP